MKAKVFIIILVIVLLGVLIKCNVRAVKTTPTDEEKKSSVLALDLNSDIIKNLYESLNMDLINNTCEDCLLNSNYMFNYYNFDGESKELSEQEELYIVFNSLYRKNSFTKEELDDGKIKLTIDETLVKDEFKKLFDIDEFDNIFQRSSDYGIIDYVYTGNSYELIINNLKNNKEVGYTKPIHASKDGNYIKLKVEAFKASTTDKELKKENPEYKLYNFANENEVVKLSYSDLKSKIDDMYKEYDFDDYTFYFELLGDNYYLKEIIRG